MHSMFQAYILKNFYPVSINSILNSSKKFVGIIYAILLWFKFFINVKGW